MDDGELELSDQQLILNSESSSSIQPTLSSDLFLDGLLRTAQTCTHTHTCNPPGPDATHTHTCYHTHTHVIPSNEDIAGTQDGKKTPVSKPQRPAGNREAVRKYREKKRAQTAYLEEEVKKLRMVNRELMRKLQKQTVLEEEASRLRALLLHLKEKIDDELTDFPFQKQCSINTVNAFREDECRVPPQVNGADCSLPGAPILSNSVDGYGNLFPVRDHPGSLSYVENAGKCLQDSAPPE
ncbi:basic leucine zipper 19-like [Andrographis paniculata]|uniref:basic leucine zipper 19-like n=1 Tax=Andrographis paniculata TaxID=175694 RepID=UPI0021E96500|nr:basic leucine zipper 19-like [Andrographis paniculata]